MEKHKNHVEYILRHPFIVKRWSRPPPGGDPRAKTPLVVLDGRGNSTFSIGSTYTFHTPSGANIGRLVQLTGDITDQHIWGSFNIRRFARYEWTYEWTFDPACMTHGSFSYSCNTMDWFNSRTEVMESLTRLIHLALTPLHAPAQYVWTHDGLTQMIKDDNIGLIQRSPSVKLNSEVIAELLASLTSKEPKKKKKAAVTPSPPGYEP